MQAQSIKNILIDISWQKKKVILLTKATPFYSIFKTYRGTRVIHLITYLHLIYMRYQLA